MAASDDEDDYMSEKFLQTCADVRPGLVSGEVARKLKNEKKEKECNQKYRTKSKTVLEREKRDEGLQKSLGADNKGFSMLQKMGFKPGMTLGKSGASGRTEPVPIELKVDRSGLGQKAEQKRRYEESAKMRANMLIKRRRDEEARAENYRSQLSERQQERKMEQDLFTSQKACEQLDSQKGIHEPCEKFYWPAASLPVHEDDDEEEEQYDDYRNNLTAQDMLFRLTAYLRFEHSYCIWCGTCYSDEDDLINNCPGDTAEAHDEL